MTTPADAIRKAIERFQGADVVLCCDWQERCNQIMEARYSIAVDNARVCIRLVDRFGDKLGWQWRAELRENAKGIWYALAHEIVAEDGFKQFGTFDEVLKESIRWLDDQVGPVDETPERMGWVDSQGRPVRG